MDVGRKVNTVDCLLNHVLWSISRGGISNVSKYGRSKLANEPIRILRLQRLPSETLILKGYKLGLDGSNAIEFVDFFIDPLGFL